MLKGSVALTSLRANCKAVEASTLRAGYAMSPLLDFRRQRLRQGWVGYTSLTAEETRTVWPLLALSALLTTLPRSHQFPFSFFFGAENSGTS